MDKKICICVIGSDRINNTEFINTIHNYGKLHQLPEIVIISDEEFKKQSFNKDRENIKMHTELILKSVKYEDYERVILSDHTKFIRQQDKLRERNFKSNFKIRK